jgi:hypothetical protein
MKKLYFLALILYPWTIGCTHTATRSDGNWLELAGGGGRFTQENYVPATCGPVPVGRYDAGYIDGAAAIQINDSSGLTFSFGGGFIPLLSLSEPRWYIDTVRGQISSTRNTPYGYFSIGGNWDYWGIEIGVLGIDSSINSHLHSVSGLSRIRFGCLDGFYVMGELFPHTNYLASGGLFDVGLGYYFKQFHTSIFAGVGGIDSYMNTQVVTRVESEISDNLTMFGSMNAGLIRDNTFSGDPLEIGVSVGVRIKFSK